MKLRTILTAAALAAVSTLGLAVPLAGPASAASCGAVENIAGSNARATTLRGGDFSMTWSGRASAASHCSTDFTYEQFIYQGTTLYGSSAASGTNAFGQVTFPSLTTAYLPAGVTTVTYGVRVSLYDVRSRTTTVQSEMVRRIDVAGYSYSSATGEHVYLEPCKPGVSYGYAQPCLPTIPF